MTKQGILLMVSGPSGTGKGTVCNALLQKYPSMGYSVSMTTRAPRVGEVEGKDYFFVDKNTFEKMIENNELLEYAKVYDNYYGTPASYVLQALGKGKDVILEIEMDGAGQVKKRFSDGVMVFVLPPSLEELAARLKKRGKDDAEAIRKRLKSAANEIAQAVSYDYVIINNQVDDSVAQLEAILSAEKSKVSRNMKTIEDVRYEAAQF